MRNIISQYASSLAISFASREGGIERAIRRHRRWTRVVQKAKLRTKPGCALSSLAIGPTLAIAKALERVAWNRFVKLLPRQPHEAEQKILHLMALSIGAHTHFSEADVERIHQSVGAFAGDVRALLGLNNASR